MTFFRFDQDGLYHAAAAVFVRLKLAVDNPPDTAAVTVNDPTMLLALLVGAVAMPAAFVIAVAVVPLPANVPPAPDAGPVKVTVTPLNGFPPPSVSLACNAAPNGEFTGVLCPDPPAIFTY